MLLLFVICPSRHGDISTLCRFRPYIFWKLLVQGYQNCYYKVWHIQIQIHKYSMCQSARKTQHVAYFWKGDCSRISKIIFLCVKRANPKIWIHKYTNIQIQLWRSARNDSAMCQTRKYKNTNTQIYKYTNTAYGKVPERPNVWHIFEKRIFQGYQKLYSHTIQTWTSEFRTVVRGLVTTSTDLTDINGSTTGTDTGNDSIGYWVFC